MILLSSTFSGEPTGVEISVGTSTNSSNSSYSTTLDEVVGMTVLTLIDGDNFCNTFREDEWTADLFKI